MQDDEMTSTVDAMIQSAEDFRRANRFPDDHQVLSILPDSLYARLNGQQREDLMTIHHVITRSYSEEYGEDRR